MVIWASWSLLYYLNHKGFNSCFKKSLLILYFILNVKILIVDCNISLVVVYFIVKVENWNFYYFLWYYLDMRSYFYSSNDGFVVHIFVIYLLLLDQKILKLVFKFHQKYRRDYLIIGTFMNSYFQMKIISLGNFKFNEW